MAAYYNEFDPFAAAWLRALIKQGMIADGEVDERSIVDIRPDELSGFTQCHFFAGIGVWSYALRRAGWRDDRPVWTGSCPCQPFSAAGKGAGFDDERHLWPHFHWLISQCRPDIVFGEQVASKDGLGWLDLVQADLEGTGYTSGAVDLCAAGVGAPHIRQRLWWIAERMADTVRGGQPGSWQLGQPRDPASSGNWEVNRIVDDGGRSGVANAERSGHQRIQIQRPASVLGTLDEQGEPQFTTGAHGSTLSRMADAESRGWREEQPDSGRGVIGIEPRQAVGYSGLCGTGGMADACNVRHERREGIGWETERGAEYSGGYARRPGHADSFWSASDWLFCRDGKWRPVEPGTFPLAHGSPARVGRLRGYGNAINAEAAQIFIEAALEAMGE